MKLLVRYAIFLFVISPSLIFSDAYKLEKYTKSGFENLLNRTSEITNVYSFIEDAKSNELLTTTADFEAVYPVNVNAVYKVLRDMEKYPQFLPRMKKINITKKINKDEENMRTFMVVVFMGFNTEYDYEMNVKFGNPAPGRYTVQSLLVQSFDKKFESIHSSWYLEEVMIQGKPHTYIRLYMRTVFREYLPGQKYIVKKFNTNDSADSIQRICRRAAAYSNNK